LNKGKLVHWWHGDGAFVDFFNPKAKKWFTNMMDRVLDMGFDGWKCDGADPLIYLLRPWAYSPALKRYIRYHEYADQYYGTFYNYTLTRNPEGLIMSRPVDSAKGLAFLNYSPKYVMFMGWVGDQHNDIEGLRQAMINVIHSASQNYLNFGFDIGGYKTNGPSQKWLFLRWAQMGAMVPFMENGGNGIH
jgi:alpha-glucosidase (family GH31 glycosyl hydrolase)